MMLLQTTTNAHPHAIGASHFLSGSRPVEVLAKIAIAAPISNASQRKMVNTSGATSLFEKNTNMHRDIALANANPIAVRSASWGATQ